MYNTPGRKNNITDRCVNSDQKISMYTPTTKLFEFCMTKYMNGEIFRSGFNFFSYFVKCPSVKSFFLRLVLSSYERMRCYYSTATVLIENK